MASINRLLASKTKELSSSDRNILTSLIEKCVEGTNPVAKVINKRLGDQLSYYFFKGKLPEYPSPLVKKYGLETELNVLAKEILPVLRLHSKVHGPYYKQEIEQRLLKPLFQTLRQTTIPTVLPVLLSPKEELVRPIHAYMHKLAFVLGGLALVQQSVVYSDMWNLKLTISNTKLKELATSFGLLEMIKNPHVGKEAIKNKLVELMKHIADEYELPYGEVEQHKMAAMLELVKEEKSLACKSFLDEITSLNKRHIIEGKETLNSHNLISEFKDELTYIRTKTKELTQEIKAAHTSEDMDPVVATIPVLRSGREVNEERLTLKKS